MNVNLINADCLDAMRDIPDGSVDMVLTDPPYGTTACKWDSVIPFEPMWEQLKRITKPNGAIVLTASQPFTSALVMSNVKMFRHEWIWKKNRGSNFASLKYQPMKEHESVLVFSKSKAQYFPIKQERSASGLARSKYKFTASNTGRREALSGLEYVGPETIPDLRCPSSVQQFNTEVGLHPTQKPVALMEYLTRTYTNAGETVLDFTMGSGTTGVACKNLGRSFIGIEMDADYFATASVRIDATPWQMGA